MDLCILKILQIFFQTSCFLIFRIGIFVKKVPFKILLWSPDAIEGIFCFSNAALNLQPAHTIKGFRVIFRFNRDIIHTIFVNNAYFGRGFCSIDSTNSMWIFFSNSIVFFIFFFWEGSEFCYFRFHSQFFPWSQGTYEDSVSFKILEKVIYFFNFIETPSLYGYNRLW